MSPQPALVMTESVTVPMSESDLWDLFINNPTEVAQCVPGAVVESIQDDGVIKGHIEVALGATKVRFAGTVVTEYDPEERHITLSARGSDSRGKTRASSTIHVRMTAVEASTPTTTMDVAASVDVSGALAGFVRSGGTIIATQMISEFRTNLGTLFTPEPGNQRHPEPPKPLRVLNLLGSTIIRSLRNGLRRVFRMLDGRR